MTSPETDTAVLEPSEGSPETGQVHENGVLISVVDHWVEDGRHVLRSREFDTTAEHEDLQQAAQMFYENTEDLLRFLADLVAQQQATQHELELCMTLLPRFMLVWQESERQLEAAQRRILNLPRRPARAPSYLRSTPSGSSQPLPV